MQIRVYYEDTDAGGIVYHANYFRYCERARSEDFWSNGFEVVDSGRGFVVKSIRNANFIKPAKLGDILEVKTKLISHKKTSFVVLHEIFRGEQKIFETEILAVYVQDEKPVKMSDEIIRYLTKSS